MVKTFGYYLFALVYLLCKPLPIKKKRVFCIMTHDDGEGSNVSIAAKALENRKEGYTFSYLKKSDTMAVKSIHGIKTMINFFFHKPYELARAEIIMLDNIFLPFAYLKRKKGTKVIQLWHGTGSIKKFGQDVNQGKLKELEKRANANITHLIVSSQATVEQYIGAFGVNKEVVYPIGLPRTDELFHRMKKLELTKKNPDKEVIYHKYGIPEDKKLILYAPTFRDNEADNTKLLELISELSKELPQEYYLGLRLHPHIADKFAREHLDQRICQFSFEKDLNGLLMASDILITDYSSIIFEYCITKQPMIFYAFDINEFSDVGRGFYCDYENYVPGPVAYRCSDVLNIIHNKEYQNYNIEAFLRESYIYADGNATERLIDLIEERD